VPAHPHLGKGPLPFLHRHIGVPSSNQQRRQGACTALVCSPQHRCPPVLPRSIGVRTARQQQLHGWGMAVGGGPVQGGVPLVVPHVHKSIDTGRDSREAVGSNCHHPRNVVPRLPLCGSNQGDPACPYTIFDNILFAFCRCRPR
jgi:hypothetical protein